MDKDRLVASIAEAYVASHDFNGTPATQLAERLGRSCEDVRALLRGLVEAGDITLAFYSVSGNPHIRRLPDLPVAEQLRLLQTEEPSGVCAYPSSRVVQDSVDVSAYDDRPFTKRLLLGEAHLQPVFFELGALDRYYQDPRYIFRFYDYSGWIGLADEHYERETTQDRDKVFLQSFGLGHSAAGNRVVAVYLWDLSGLSPDHQAYWNTFVVASGCRLTEEYRRESVLGDWPDHGCIYQAFLEEQRIINRMSKLMGRPHLFRRTFEEDVPREFTVFVRPTLGNYHRFALTLDKMLSENIDPAFFQGEVDVTREITRADGRVECQRKNSLVLLDEWLRKSIRVHDGSCFDTIKDGLREVRRLRQKPAHALAEDQYHPRYEREQAQLMLRAYEAVRLIRLLFANHPAASACEVPDWLQRGRIRVY